MLLNAKPILSFDGGHMKHVMWGSYHVLVCGTQDGESEESYRFFIQTMKKSPELQQYLSHTSIVVTSDKDKGLRNAIKAELPLANHRCCALHLLGNIKTGRPFNDSDRTLYWEIVFAESEMVFKDKMEILKQTHREAYDFLSNFNPQEWTNWAFPGPTWGHVTNNLFIILKFVQATGLVI